MYDYLVVGSGLYGATFAQQAKAHGKSVLVIDKRPNIAGNIYTEKVEGINFHKYSKSENLVSVTLLQSQRQGSPHFTMWTKKHW